MVHQGHPSRRDFLVLSCGSLLGGLGCGERQRPPSRMAKQFLSGAKLSSDILERDLYDHVPDTVKAVVDFFEQRKSGVASFAQDVLSFEGKLAYAKGVYDPESHDRFLEKSFSQNIFTPDELGTVIESAVSSYVQRLSAGETELLQSLHNGIRMWSGQPPHINAIPLEVPELIRKFDIALMELKPTIVKDIGVDIGKSAIGEIVQKVTMAIVSNIAGAVATRMGISSGVLGSGAAGSVATFGTSLISAMMINFALDWIVEQSGYDPEAEVSRRVVLTLDRVRNLVVEGEFPPDLPPLYDADQDPRYEGVYRYELTVDPISGSKSQRMILEKPWLVGPYQDAKTRAFTEKAARQKEADVRLADGPGLRYQLIKFNQVRSKLRVAALEEILNSMT